MPGVAAIMAHLDIIVVVVALVGVVFEHHGVDVAVELEVGGVVVWR
ncbi:MAG: hypothetical protein PUE35_03440 [Bacteroidales bacterium]|nr:hypothetical protein [Bacteroidales bacterium]